MKRRGVLMTHVVCCLLLSVAACGFGNITREGAGGDGGQHDSSDGDVSLTVTLTGPGMVTSTPAGINCGTDCSKKFPPGTSVELTATPETDATFLGWSGGGCSGTGACTVSGNSDTTVQAMFAMNNSVVVTMAGNGMGKVTSSPAGIDCTTGTCMNAYMPGTSVTLTATPSTGTSFTGWSGACIGTAMCSVTVNAITQVTGTFTLNKTDLTVTLGGDGNGSVTATPTGLSCSGSTCSGSYDYATMVTLSATPSNGSAFAGWAGPCTVNGNMCTVSMTQMRSIQATFNGPRTLSVTRTGTGFGSVASNPAAINCGITCSSPFMWGSMVTLTATPATGSTFAGWSGDCAGTSTTCTLSMTAARAATAKFDAQVTPNYMFITSTTTTGNMGGLAGADSICQARAQAANLPGTYRAWLSTTTVDAYTRLGTASGWVRTDGKPFADTIAQIRASMFYYPPRVDENGAHVLTGFAFTGTTVDGVYGDAFGADCGAWTSTSGSTTGGYAAASGFQWTVGFGDNCTSSYRIYCFGIDKQSSAMPAQPAGAVRRAFMTPWPSPAAGIGSADATCQSAAQGANLPGSYKTLLATNGASALSRFNLQGPPWYRVDDVAVLPTTASWTTSAYFDADPNLAVDGSMTFGNSADWTGATSLTTAGTSVSTCNNWGSTTANAWTGNANRNQISLFFGSSPIQCNNPNVLITCLQE